MKIAKASFFIYLTVYIVVVLCFSFLIWQTRLLEKFAFVGNLANYLVRTKMTPYVLASGEGLKYFHLAGILGLIILSALLVFSYRMLWSTRSKSQIWRIVLGTISGLLLICGSAVLMINLVISGYVETAFNMDNTVPKAIHYKSGYQALVSHLQDSKTSATLTFNKLINEVEQGAINLNSLIDEDYIELGTLVGYLVDEQGGVINKQQHYFRNYFSRAPASLREMLLLIQSQPDNPFHWRLLKPQNSYFHMMGPYGEYNLKFISEDGHFEAVYNKRGILLTAGTGPLNMGTFNYASPIDALGKHSTYDVETYMKWNNVPSLGPVDKNEMQEMKKKFDSNPNALLHYMKYVSILKITP